MPLNKLNNLFGKSPFEPIQEHIKKAEACAIALQPFINAVIDKDWQGAETAQQQIVKLEHEADLIKKQIRLNLPSNLFLPVPRRGLDPVARSRGRNPARPQRFALFES